MNILRNSYIRKLAHKTSFMHAYGNNPSSNSCRSIGGMHGMTSLPSLIKVSILNFIIGLRYGCEREHRIYKVKSAVKSEAAWNQKHELSGLTTVDVNWAPKNWRFEEWFNNTLKDNTIRCKKLITIVSGRKNVHSCLPVFAWRRVVLRFFDPKQLLRVSCILWRYLSKCY